MTLNHTSVIIPCIECGLRYVCSQDMLAPTMRSYAEDATHVRLLDGEGGTRSWEDLKSGSYARNSHIFSICDA